MAIVKFAAKIKLDLKSLLLKKQLKEIEEQHGIKLTKVKKPNTEQNNGN